MRRFLLLAFAVAYPIIGCHPRTQATSPSARVPKEGVDCVRAWWITARFEPSRDSVEGVPIQAINSTWAAALTLNHDVLPRDAACDPSQLADSSVAFALGGDFNRDGLADRAIVGVYRDTLRTTGRFLLILTRRATGWQKADLLTMRGEAGFSVLTQRADTIGWWFCMECDDGFRIAWDGRRYAPVPSDST
jgi:hypothetical protein